MGPMWLANLLEPNETQTGIFFTAFRIVDDQGLLLLELRDLCAILNLVADNGKSLQAITAP
jgi:hypothetical protein